MKKITERTALVLHYSCTGNTAKIAHKASQQLKKQGWRVKEMHLREIVPEVLSDLPNLIVLGVPVQYWAVPPVALDLIRNLPPLPGVSAFVYCTYGGCIQSGVPFMLARELSSKGAIVLGGAAIVAPHSCLVESAGGKRLGEIDPRFGKGQPDAATVNNFCNAIDAVAEQAYAGIPSPLDLDRLKMRTTGRLAALLEHVITLNMKIGSMPDILCNRDKCIGCNQCISVCDAGGMRNEKVHGPVTIKDKCKKCYACVMNCPAGALSTNWRLIERMVRLMHALASPKGTEIVYAGQQCD